MIRVVLVDHQELVRPRVRRILRGEGHVEVVGEAPDGGRALEVIRATDPDVVLLDLRMPVLDGLDVLRAMAGERSAVVVLTTFDTDANVREALALGAAGFLLKDAPADRLVGAVRAAAGGDAVLARSVARRVAADLAARPTTTPPALVHDLTAREREVLGLMAEGCSNAEIATALHIVEGTVKTHVARILMKLGVRDRLQAVVAAYRSGLVG